MEDWLSTTTRSLPPHWRYWSTKERTIDRRVSTIAQQLQIEGLLDRLPRQLSGGKNSESPLVEPWREIPSYS
ncbi:MAG: hypothetical protein HC881_07160 [Leptolyngbyaceae cyanobacterium SL_7_1]|nr:hypothetical protein [Leptolyngbyaceae cyanobacterium SL_7_1]